MKGNGIDAQSRLLKGPASQMKHFHALLSNAIRADDRIHFAPVAPQIVETSSGDRIAKIWELKQAGALTVDEYEAEKRAILSNSASPTRLEKVNVRRIEG